MSGADADSEDADESADADESVDESADEVTASGQNDSELKPLRIDSELWSHSEMIGRIVDRYFVRHDEAAGAELAWHVGVDAEQTDAYEALKRLNKRLSNLTWVAILQEGEPYVVVILPEPPVLNTLSTGQQFLAWGTFFLFTVLAGSAWLVVQRSGTMVLEVSNLLDAVIWFAFPLTASMLMASELRKMVGSNRGLEVGSLMPIGFPFLITPSLPIWPFAIFASMGMRREDLLPFKQRAHLAVVSLTAPLTMIVLGTAMSVAGLLMTPSSAPSLSSIPASISVNPISNLIVSFLIPADEIALRSNWLHPLGLAGVGLSILGWVLLLPFPRMPGDRILYALLGPEKASEGSTQTLLFVLALLITIFVMLNGSYWPWLIIVIFSTWRRFSEDGPHVALILDETKQLPDSTRNSVGIVLVMAMLLAFPGMMPVQAVSDWDEGLDTSDWPDKFSLVAGETSPIVLPLAPTGVVPIDLTIRVEVTRPIPGFNYEIDCPGDVIAAGASAAGITFIECQVDAVERLNTDPLLLTVSAAAFPAGQIRFHILVYQRGGLPLVSHDVLVTQKEGAMPLATGWTWDSRMLDPTLCTTIRGDAEFGMNLSLEHPLWSFAGPSQIAAGEETDVCITGVPGSLVDLPSTATPDGIAGSHWSASIGHDVLAPNLYVTMDDGGTHVWRMFIDGLVRNYSAGTYYDEVLSRHAGRTWLWSEDGEVLDCPLGDEPREPERDENGSWVIDLTEMPQAVVPMDSENGTAIWPDHGLFIICEDSANVIRQFGPAPATLAVQSWVDLLPFTNTTLISYTSEDVVLAKRYHGDVEASIAWNLTSNLTVTANSTLLLEFGEERPEVHRVAWVESDETTWYLHLAAWCIAEEGCEGLSPLGGDE